MCLTRSLLSSPAAFHSAEKQETFYKALAGMVVLSETADKATCEEFMKFIYLEF